MIGFDNFEQINQFASSTIVEWYHQSVHAHFIVTSRQRLSVSMEEVYELPPFQEEEAIQFFIAQQNRIGIKESPSPKDRERISTIVQKIKTTWHSN